MSPKVRPKLLLLLINLISIFGLLHGFEFYLRQRDPARHLPINGSIEDVRYTWGHRVDTNRFGFRERDFDAPKAPGVYRVMVLGDSLTWGAGLAVEERYTNIAEGLLRGTFPRPRIEVLNFGIEGGPTVVERTIVRKLKDVVEPDRIVLGFCFNDPKPESQEHSVEKQAFEEKYGFLIEGFQDGLLQSGWPYLGEASGRSLYILLERLGLFPPWQVALQRTYDKDSTQWESFVQALREIKQMSDEMLLPPPIFLTLNQGAYLDRPTDYRKPDETLLLYLSWYHQAEEAAARAGFVTHNVEKEIASRLPGKVLAVNELDGHPSAELNLLYAEKLAKALAPNIPGESGDR